MQKLFILISIFLLVSCSDNNPLEDTGLISGTGITVNLTETANGNWQAEYVFSEPLAALLLTNSNGDYRRTSWRSLDPNAALQRLDGQDVLVFKKPTTRTLFELTPFTGYLSMSYTPFIPFSDGGIMIFSGQFNAYSITSIGDNETWSEKIQNQDFERPVFGTRLTSAKTMIHDGEIVTAETVDISKGTYIYVGNADIVQGQNFSGVIDPGLPPWFANHFDDDLSQIFSTYRRLWNAGLPQKSGIYIAFRGYEAEGLDFTGGALDNMLMLEISGNALRDENPMISRYLRWFLAHEIAHLFQKRSGSHGTEPWMQEGSANAMAHLALLAAKKTDQTEISKSYGETFKKCTDALTISALPDAEINQEQDPPYQCGDLMAQITASALPDYNLFAFWNELILDGGEKEDEPSYSQEDYFELFLKRGGPKSIMEGLRKMATEKLDDPAPFVQNLMKESGLEVEFDEHGQLTFMKLPD